jgi:hypothetical protein
VKFDVLSRVPELWVTVRLWAMRLWLVTVKRILPAGTSCRLRSIAHSLSVACTSVVVLASPDADRAGVAVPVLSACSGAVVGAEDSAVDVGSAAIVGATSISSIAGMVDVGATSMGRVAVGWIEAPVEVASPQAARAAVARTSIIVVSIICSGLNVLRVVLM